MKENKRLVIIIVAVAAVLIIAGSVGAYFLIKSNKKDENTDTNNVITENAIDENQLQMDGEYDENTLPNGNEISNTITQGEENKEEQNNTENTNKEPEISKTETKKEETQNTESKPKASTPTTSKTETTSSSAPKTSTTTSTTTSSSASKTSTTESKAPTKTGTDTSRELTNTETKYGVVIKTYTTTTYDVYSDGSKKEVSKKTDTEYDQSGYKASTSELQTEAKQLKSSNASLINSVFVYVNEYRKEANTKAVDEVTNRKDLVLDSDLTVAACARAIEMAYGNKYSHTRPNGSDCFSILGEMGIRWSAVGENIAKGQASAKSVSESWKNSSGHYANMINASYGKIGIGVIKFRGTYYWVQMFTN